jgi:hypothetical protein
MPPGNPFDVEAEWAAGFAQAGSSSSTVLRGRLRGDNSG